MTRCTFVAYRGTETDPLSTIFVRLYSLDGVVVFSDEFIVGVPDIGIKYLKVPPGEYMAWVRASGTKFAWRSPVTIPPPEDDPHIVEFRGDSSVNLENQHAVLVHGWVTSLAPTVMAGKHPVSHSSTVYGGFGRTPTYQNLDIVFRLLHDGSRADGLLMGRSILRTGFDRNGYFEVELLPDSVYEVLVPGVPARKLKTHTSGIRDLRELILGAANTHLFDLA